MLFMATWKQKAAPQQAVGSRGFVKAESEKDARRIMQENLDSAYEVTGIYPAQEHQITPQAITVNFRNTSEYRLFG